jgi:2-iminoacetate synthase
MNFADIFADLDREDLRLTIYGTTDVDVERALQHPAGDIKALMALLSPAAEPYLEIMAQQAMEITRRRFGHNISLFIPMYLYNLCANESDYCGFTMSNKIKRKILNSNEIQQEIDIIKGWGFDSILLVFGEHESKVGVEYFADVLPQNKQHFSHLAHLGLDTVMLYQDTYHPVTYARH